MTHRTNTAGKLPPLCCLALVALLSIGCSNDGPDGKDFYEDFCASGCHGRDNLGLKTANLSTGPVNVPSTQAIKDAIRDIPAMNIAELTTLRTGEINAIAIYIPTIKFVSKEIYDQFCATNCHGVDNKGNQAAGVGPVDDPSVAAIKNAILNVSEMNTINQPALSTLSDAKIQVISDVISLIP